MQISQFERGSGIKGGGSEEEGEERAATRLLCNCVGNKKYSATHVMGESPG